MPTTFEEVARQLVAAIDSDATYLLAFQWIRKRYEQLATRAKLRHLRKLGALTTPAAIDTGTVSITRGTRIITGDAAATAAWGPQLVGRHIRLRVTWCEIVNYQVVGGFGQLTLDTDYNEDDVSAGGYRIVQRFLPLAEDARQIGDTFINPRRRWPIRLKTLTELDRMAPARSHVAGGATVVVEVTPTIEGTRRVELYPYSTTSETYHYVYWRPPHETQLHDYVHPALPVYALIEGGMIDLLRYKMGKAIDAGKQETAALWRNEMNTQETKWNRQYMIEAIAADRGEDDATFILRGIGGSLEPHDIVTAKDHVLAGWNWPS